MKGLISFGLGFLTACLVFGILSIADVVEFGKDAKEKFDDETGGNETQEAGLATPLLTPPSARPPQTSVLGQEAMVTLSNSGQRVLTESL